MKPQRVATQLAGTENLEPAGDPGEEMMKQGEQTNSPLLENLEHVLTDFGKQKGTDYQEEDLLRTAQLTDYYPDTTQPQASSYKSGTIASTYEPQQVQGTLAQNPPLGGRGATRIVYYYHPDYLGNVEYITDADGLPYQYFWYSPWGENLKEENATTNGWSSPYCFNGKELDQETGLYYYGARYYNPQVSVWLAVDAMASNAHNFPLTPYHFSANNPIMFMDPDGNDWYEVLNEETGQVEVKWTDFGSQKEMNENGLKGTYLGKQGSALDEITGEAIYYNVDGTTTRKSNKLAEITITPEGAYQTTNPSIGTNNQTGYTYNERDLVVRNAVLATDNPIARHLLNQEALGNYWILNGHDYWLYYGHTLGNMILMQSYIEAATDLTDAGSLPSFKSRGFKLNPRMIESAKPVVPENSWNAFLQRNKGRFKGEGWQSRAAEAYWKEQGY